MIPETKAGRSHGGFRERSEGMSMRIAAIIPTRYGSTRFPGKPLARIAGRPMVEHVYRRTEACPDIALVIAATDDQRIFDVVTGFGGRAVMTAPSHASGTDRIAEAAESLDLEDGDIVVNVQGDQPLLHPSLLTRMVEPLIMDDSIPMSTLMFRIRDSREVPNPNHVKVVTDHKGFALYFSRQPIPHYRDPGPADVHFKHLGLYAYRKGFLSVFTQLSPGRLEVAEKLEQLRALEHGFPIRVVETDHDSPEVDIPEDVERVEEIMARSPGL